MAQPLVCDLDAKVLARLSERARHHGGSLDKEAKAIFEVASRRSTPAEARDAAARVRRRLAGRSFSDSADLVRADRERGEPPSHRYHRPRVERR